MSAGIDIVTATNGRDVVGDMEAEESREIATKEDSTIIMGPTGREESRWTEMSIAGGDVAIMAWEINGRAAKIGKAVGGFG